MAISKEARDFAQDTLSSLQEYHCIPKDYAYPVYYPSDSKRHYHSSFSFYSFYCCCSGGGSKERDKVAGFIALIAFAFAFFAGLAASIKTGSDAYNSGEEASQAKREMNKATGEDKRVYELCERAWKHMSREQAYQSLSLLIGTAGAGCITLFLVTYLMEIEWMYYSYLYAGIGALGVGAVSYYLNSALRAKQHAHLQRDCEELKQAAYGAPKPPPTNPAYESRPSGQKQPAHQTLYPSYVPHYS